MQTRIHNLADFEKLVSNYTPRQGQIFQGEYGLAKIKKFLSILDNPQNKLKVIHIAGTSGKGSTAFYTSGLLKTHNFKVGLMVSPHLCDIRERFQINNLLISESKLIKYFNRFIPAIEKFNQVSDSQLSYFEILVSFGFFVFYLEQVDFAVIETGLGGMYDGTNCISNKNKIVVLTKIGLDHTNVLGKTIAKITEQKAAIISPKNNVISIKQVKVAKDVIKKVASKNHSPLSFLSSKDNFQVKKQGHNTLNFNFKLEDLKIDNIVLSTSALYQVENCSLALAALKILSEKYKFKINKDKILKSLRTLNFSGRMEFLNYKGKEMILDGAHNPQKIRSLALSLKRLFPGEKFDFIVSFKVDKDYSKNIDIILPLANKIYLSNFNHRQDYIIKTQPALVIAKYLTKNKFTNWEIVDNPLKAIKLASQTGKDRIIITGSLYLLAKILPKLKNYKK